MTHLMPLALGGFRHVVRASTNATRQGPVDTASAASTETAEAATAAYNALYANNLDLALLLGVAAFFLVAAPVMSAWVSSGRFNQGWSLSTRKIRRDEVWTAGEKDSHIRIEGLVVPASIRAVSEWYATWRWVYNRALLPMVPVLDLTVGQVLVCLSYEALVFLFMFLNAGDISVNYARPGLISVAQIPAVYLLATKNSIVSVVGKGYEKLNFLHRVAGRMMILCGLLHSVLFFRAQTAPIEWSLPIMYTGLIAMVAMCLTLVTSISYFRRAFYRVFLISHIIGWVTFIIAINVHVPTVARFYTLIGLGGLLLDFTIRIAGTRVRNATVVALAGGTTMVQVHGIESGWRAGQHVWLRVGSGGWWRKAESHPFTVANAPADASALSGAHNLTILAQSRGDWTRKLLDAAGEADQITEKGGGYGRTVTVSVEGPYGGPMFNDMSESQNVVLFAGGSGITFAAALLDEMVGQAVEGTCRIRSVTLVWTMKSIDRVDWYAQMFSSLLELARTRPNLEVRVQLFVTGPRLASHCPIRDAHVAYYRPDPLTIIENNIDEIIASVCEKGSVETRGGGLAVGTCGPMALVRTVRSAVGAVERRRAVKAGGIVAHTECFGW